LKSSAETKKNWMDKMPIQYPFHLLLAALLLAVPCCTAFESEQLKPSTYFKNLLAVEETQEKKLSAVLHQMSPRDLARNTASTTAAVILKTKYDRSLKTNSTIPSSVMTPTLASSAPSSINNVPTKPVHSGPTKPFHNAPTKPAHNAPSPTAATSQPTQMSVAITTDRPSSAFGKKNPSPSYQNNSTDERYAVDDGVIPKFPAPSAIAKPSSSPPAPSSNSGIITRWKNGDKSVGSAKQGMHEIAHDQNVWIAAIVLGVVGFIILLIVVQQLIENPQGCVAKLCRCQVAFYRILCWPCRKICGCGGPGRNRRTRNLVQTHDMDEDGYRGDLELS
jgi:hypothetical protein